MILASHLRPHLHANSRRVGACVALLACVLTLAGCGAGLRRIGIGGGSSHRDETLATRSAKRQRGESPRETALAKNLRETREAAVLAPAEPYWPYHVAELYAGADSMSRAEAALAQALARDAAYAPALALRSSLDYRAGRHESAIRLLEAAIAQPGAFPNGVPAELTEGLALHYDALGKSDRAKALIDAGALPKGAATPALVFLTLKGPAPDQAGELAESAVKHDPRSAVNQNNYAITLLRKGDPIAARRSFEWAMKLDPALPGPYYNLAILEKYYLFDDSTATLRFADYWKRSQDDPDGLAAIFGVSARKALAQDGN